MLIIEVKIVDPLFCGPAVSPEVSNELVVLACKLRQPPRIQYGCPVYSRWVKGEHDTFITNLPVDVAQYCQYDQCCCVALASTQLLVVLLHAATG